MNHEEEHALLWNERLQDWLDGDVEATERAKIETHIADCGACRAHFEQLRGLDHLLRKAAPPIALDASFDARLFARIEATGAAAQTAARRRIEQELHASLAALARSRRRALTLGISGVAGGAATAFALVSSFFSADLAQWLAQSGDATLVSAALTTLLGAGVGVSVARWLVCVAD